jgi:hypothetical protein
MKNEQCGEEMAAHAVELLTFFQTHPFSNWNPVLREEISGMIKITPHLLPQIFLSSLAIVFHESFVALIPLITSICFACKP